jgi:hypothetical protein
VYDTALANFLGNSVISLNAITVLPEPLGPVSTRGRIVGVYRIIFYYSQSASLIISIITWFSIDVAPRIGSTALQLAATERPTSPTVLSVKVREGRQSINQQETYKKTNGEPTHPCKHASRPRAVVLRDYEPETYSV